jgi:hypothetical protein
LTKLIAGVELVQQKQAQRTRAALQSHRGATERTQTTRSIIKQLYQVANIRSVLSLSETPQFYDQLTSGNQATFITEMPLPRTPNPPKVAASGGKKKKKSASTADMKAEEDLAEVERGRVEQREMRPREEDIREESSLSATFSDVSGFAKAASEIQVDNRTTQRRMAVHVWSMFTEWSGG